MLAACCCARSLRETTRTQSREVSRIPGVPRRTTARVDFHSKPPLNVTIIISIGRSNDRGIFVVKGNTRTHRVSRRRFHRREGASPRHSPPRRLSRSLLGIHCWRSMCLDRRFVMRKVTEPLRALVRDGRLFLSKTLPSSSAPPSTEPLQNY